MEKGGRWGQRVSQCVRSFWSAGVRVFAHISNLVFQVPTERLDFLDQPVKFYSHLHTWIFYCSMPIKPHTYLTFTYILPVSSKSWQPRKNSLCTLLISMLCELRHMFCEIDPTVSAYSFACVYQITHLKWNAYCCSFVHWHFLAFSCCSPSVEACKTFSFNLAWCRTRRVVLAASLYPESH